MLLIAALWLTPWLTPWVAARFREREYKELH